MGRIIFVSFFQGFSRRREDQFGSYCRLRQFADDVGVEMRAAITVDAFWRVRMREQVGQHFLDVLGCLVLCPEGEGVVGENVHDQQEGVVCARDGCEVHQQDVQRVVCLGHDRI